MTCRSWRKCTLQHSTTAKKIRLQDGISYEMGSCAWSLNIHPQKRVILEAQGTKAIISEWASGLLPPSSLWGSGNQTCWDNKTSHSISFCIGKLKLFSMKKNNEQIKEWPVRNRMEIQDTYHTDEVSLCKLSLYFAVMKWPAAWHGFQGKLLMWGISLRPVHCGHML